MAAAALAALGCVAATSAFADSGSSQRRRSASPASSPTSVSLPAGGFRRREARPRTFASTPTPATRGGFDETHYWWSHPVSLPLVGPTSNGTVTLSDNFNGTSWSDYFGHSGVGPQAAGSLPH